MKYYTNVYNTAYWLINFIMLINFSIINNLSFKSKQSLNMLKSDFCESVISKENILTSSIIFGANASGKSNFIASLALLKKIVLESTRELSKNYLKEIIPFLFNKDNPDEPSEFEISILNENIYTYSLCFLNEKIISEKLIIYLDNNINSSEVLFERKNNVMEYVSESFTESYNYFDKETKCIINSENIENIPLISIIAGIGGKHSKNIINWFNKLQIISGLLDEQFLNFSLNLFDKDQEFCNWASQILPSVQISDIEFENNVVSIFENISQEELKNLTKIKKKTDGKHREFIEKFIDLVNATREIKDSKVNTTQINVVKNINGKRYELPFRLESEGTRKLIALLGPIYDSIKKNHVLVCDEIDSKFHTLLMKYILKIFNKDNQDCQLIASAQDTNLIDPNIFTEDQIWFVDKNEFGESKLYSLVEFKESASKDYSSNYLKGAYNAIPLFENKDVIENLMKN